MSDQQIYSLMKDSERIYYLVNHREKRYCIIPKEYYGFCEHLYTCRLDWLDKSVEDRFSGYDLTLLQDVNG